MNAHILGICGKMVTGIYAPAKHLHTLDCAFATSETRHKKETFSLFVRGMSDFSLI